MRRQYVYRTEKIDGVVRRIYVGTADSDEARQYLQAVEARRKTEREQRDVAALLDLLDWSVDSLRECERSAIRERGYHQTKGRKWKPDSTQ